MAFLKHLKSCLWDHYFSFRGRANRAEFWSFTLCWVAAMILLIVKSDLEWCAGSEELAFVWLAVGALLCPPCVAVIVRRLHDIERTGWWFWAYAIPFAGVLTLLFFYLKKGTDGPNRYDTDQKIHWGKTAIILASAFGVFLGLVGAYVLSQVAWNPVKVVPETFYVTEPRLANGDVDYFTALMALYSDVREHPEKNGYPRIQKRILAEKIELPSEESEYAEWVAANDDFLDDLAQAVTEPYFMPQWERPRGSMLEMNYELEPLRVLAQMLQARAKYALAAGDVDAAANDVLALYRLGRKVGMGPAIIPALVGTAIESMGASQLRELLRSENLTEAQLTRLEAGLADLPDALTLREIFDRETLVTFDMLQDFIRDPNGWNESLDTGVKTVGTGQRLGHFVDENILREYFCKYWRELEELTREPDHAVRRERHADFEKRFDNDCQSRSAASFLLLRGRSEGFGMMILGLLIPAEPQLDFAISRRDTMFKLSRLAIQTERYRIQNGRFPTSLSELENADTFDPFTGRNTLTLIPNPRTPEQWAEHYPDGLAEEYPWYPYLLYSYGKNAQDDGGELGDHLYESVDIVF